MDNKLVFDSFLLNKIMSMVPKLELDSRVETTLICHSPSFRKYTFNIKITPMSKTDDKKNIRLLSFEIDYPIEGYNYSEISKKILDFQFKSKIFHLNNFKRDQQSTIQIIDEDILLIRGDINESVKLYPVDRDQLYRMLEVTLKHLGSNMFIFKN